LQVSSAQRIDGGQDLLDRENLRGTIAHQLATLSRQVPHDTLLPRQNRSCGQQAKPQRVRQMPRIGLIAAVREAFDARSKRSMGTPNASRRYMLRPMLRR
jgi:hypothetical protein